MWQFRSWVRDEDRFSGTLATFLVELSPDPKGLGRQLGRVPRFPLNTQTVLLRAELRDCVSVVGAHLGLALKPEAFLLRALALAALHGPPRALKICGTSAQSVANSLARPHRHIVALQKIPADRAVKQHPPRSGLANVFARVAVGHRSTVPGLTHTLLLYRRTYSPPLFRQSRSRFASTRNMRTIRTTVKSAKRASTTPILALCFRWFNETSLP